MTTRWERLPARARRRPFTRLLVLLVVAPWVVLFAGWLFQVDVLLGLGKGEVTGWGTLYVYSSVRQFYPKQVLIVVPTEGARGDPVWFNGATWETALEINRAATRRDAKSIRPSRPETSGLDAGMKAGTPHPDHRMRCRVRYAGFLRKIVYEFELLPEDQAKPGSLHVK